MAKYIIEFFKHNPTGRVAVPIGVIAQDEETIIYKALPPDRWKKWVTSIDTAFFHIDKREEIETRNFKEVIYRKYDKEKGMLVPLALNDPEYLSVVVSQNVNHFWYSFVYEENGTAEEVATKVVQKLMDDEYVGKTISEFLEATSPKPKEYLH